MMSGTCTQSGTCGEGEENAIMLFGVRLTEGTKNSFRKSASMNNLSQFDDSDLLLRPLDSIAAVADSGYASDDVVHASGRARERKRGVPWSEEEHRMFLVGLEKVGKGDWRGISRNFVKTRTPTQVASHAQKYFLRRTNNNRRRRRSSLFDITTDSFGNLSSSSSSLMEEDHHHDPIPMIPPATKMAGLNLNNSASGYEESPLSLKISSPTEEKKVSPKQHFGAMSNGDGIISVA